MERGVRQGCPISPLLFILTTELFAASVRADPNIKGIKVPGFVRAIKIRLFADDTSLFLRDFIDFREILAKIKLFTFFCGLQLNKKKSFAMTFSKNNLEGSFKNGIKFVSKLKILGIIFSTHQDARDIDENFKGKIKSLEKLFSSWNRRHLSVIGKIVIVKQMGISLLVNIMQSIGIDQNRIKIIEKMIFRFIWCKNRDKNSRITERVKRSILCNERERGGLCMTNLVCFQSSFLLDWAEKLMCSEYADWKGSALAALGEVGGRAAFQGNVKSNEFKNLNKIKNNFWKAVLVHWLDHKASSSDNLATLTSQTPLFNNKNITYKNSHLFFDECIKKNILYVKDVCIDSRFVTYQEFENRLKCPNSLLIYNCLYNALKKAYPILFEINNNSPRTNNIFKENDTLMIGRKGYYKMLCSPEEPWIEAYWTRKYNKTFQKSSWMVAYNCTRETRLQVLHWKILMKIYPTSVSLFKMKMRASEMCETCRQLDTIEHFFLSL